MCVSNKIYASINCLNITLNGQLNCLTFNGSGEIQYFRRFSLPRSNVLLHDAYILLYLNEAGLEIARPGCWSYNIYTAVRKPQTKDLTFMRPTAARTKEQGAGSWEQEYSNSNKH